jgi:holin-like protein
MIPALTQLLLFQLAGELLVHGFALTIPGPVLGMLLLFGWLVLRQGPSDDLRHSTQSLLQHLSLLFIPAGTGVILYFKLLEAEWLPITVALLASTFLSMVVTAAAMHLLTRHRQASEERP